MIHRFINFVLVRLRDLINKIKCDSPYVNHTARDPRVVRDYRKRLLVRAKNQWGKSDPERFINFEKRLEKMDVDHLQNLQLGGKDVPSELSLIDRSSNRSIVTQIGQQLKNLPQGTKITGVIKE